MSKKRIIEDWERFWKLSVIKEVKQINNHRRILCECECWKIKEYSLYHLTGGKIKSCGCITKKHWMAKTRFYFIFKQLNQRCKNPRTPDYNNYWWKWIKCEWNDFTSFRDDMYISYLEHSEIYWEKNTTIDRRNWNENYSKDNCRWATRKIQSINRPNTIIYKWKSLSEWCRILWLKYPTIWNRIKIQWKDIEEVLNI